MPLQIQSLVPAPADSLRLAVDAARAAGALMRRNLRATKRVNSEVQHDIKLELDVRCQQLITRRLHRGAHTLPILGEEGTRGEFDAAPRWVVDPIDGTVNFAYGIPHACVAIALQIPCSTALRRPSQRQRQRRRPPAQAPPRTGVPGVIDSHRSILGVVYDPFCDELWTTLEAEPSRLNGRPIRVSRRTRLAQAIVALGFAKQRATLDLMLPVFLNLIHRVRKIRIMGSAALALVYVATGRMDAYVESGIRLWDIAAGGLMVQNAGGYFSAVRAGGQGADHTYHMTATNGRLTRALPAIG
jgi:myo-inositol-1(or 4)-monophosphatase